MGMKGAETPAGVKPGNREHPSGLGPAATAATAAATIGQQTALAPVGDIPPTEPEIPGKMPDASKFPVLPSVGVDLITLGQTLVRSGYFTDLKQVSQAIVKVLAGQELGIGPIRAMTEIHVTNVDDGGGSRRSQIALGATLMASLIKRSGRYDYRTLQLDEQACELEFQEIREENGKRERVAIGRSKFSMTDAARANLAGKANWKQYPRNMLFARAMSNGAKWFCSDVFGGAVYTPEEIRDLAPEAEAPEPAPAAAAEPAKAPAAPESPAAEATQRAAVPAAGTPAPAGASAAETEDQRKGRELTMVRVYRAMDAIGMKADEMRGFAVAGYGKYPEDMPVYMLALLAGKLEKLQDAKAQP